MPKTAIWCLKADLYRLYLKKRQEINILLFFYACTGPVFSSYFKDAYCLTGNSFQMKKNVRNASLVALAAGLVLIPLARYVMNRRRNTITPEPGHGPRKPLFGAYLGRTFPRKAQHNGHYQN